jgi:hypothetical protein
MVLPVQKDARVRAVTIQFPEILPTELPPQMASRTSPELDLGVA